jgi:hypothetical protein
MLLNVAAHNVSINVSTTPVANNGNNIALSVVDTGGAPWLANISAKFRENIFETVLMESSGAGGNWFMKKTRSKKSRDTVPLINCEA